MITQMHAAYMTALFLIFIGYVAGYLMGRADLSYRVLHMLVQIAKDAAGQGKPAPESATNSAPARRSRVAPAAEYVPPEISINEAKFVVPVSTAGMERAGTGELGKTTAVQDDIGASVSKLSQLKGK